MGDDRVVTDASDGTPRPTIRRVGILVVALSFVGIWGYVMYLTVFVGRAEPRDKLEDPRYAEVAEATCAPFRTRVDRFPPAGSVDDPLERAALLDAATAELEAMVDQLDGVLPPSDAEEAAADEAGRGRELDSGDARHDPCRQSGCGVVQRWVLGVVIAGPAAVIRWKALAAPVWGISRLGLQSHAQPALPYIGICRLVAPREFALRYPIGVVEVSHLIDR